MHFGMKVTPTSVLIRELLTAHQRQEAPRTIWMISMSGSAFWMEQVWMTCLVLTQGQLLMMLENLKPWGKTRTDQWKKARELITLSCVMKWKEGMTGSWLPWTGTGGGVWGVAGCTTSAVGSGATATLTVVMSGSIDATGGIAATGGGAFATATAFRIPSCSKLDYMAIISSGSLTKY